MALVLKDGSVFLHIPKTGGNWVSKILRESHLVSSEMGQTKHSDQAHLTVPLSRDGKRWLGPWQRHKIRRTLQPRPFMFCFVRHPLSWYESWFSYMSQASRNWQNFGNENDLFDWHPNSILNGCGSEDFNQFVENVITKCPGYVSQLYSRYTCPKIDFIGKQETLREDLITVLKSLGLTFDEMHIRNAQEHGVSEKPKNPVSWNESLRKEVMALERPALRAYGYDY